VSSLRDLRNSRPLMLGLVAALVVEHVMLIAAPLDVLHPIHPTDLGRRLWDGEVPYRDFALEYPPLAVVAFLLPGLLPRSLGLPALGLQALALEVVVAVVVLRHHRDALLRYAVLSLVLFPFISGGFDSFPMAALAVSTHLLAAGAAAGWWVAAAGTLVKLVPGVAWLWCRTHLRTAVVALIVTGALAALPALVADDLDDSYIGWTLHRGIQVESLAGGLVWAWREANGNDPAFVHRYRAWEVEGGDAVATGAALAAGAAALLLAARGRRDQPWLSALTLVAIALCGSKVLSPQFVTWGAPLAAVVGGRWFAGYCGVAVLTWFAYASPGGPGVLVGVALVRNLALVGLAVAGLRQLLQPGPDVVDLAPEGLEGA